MKTTAKALQTLKWAWAVMLCAGLAYTPSAFAAKQIMTYGVYAGGFHVVDANMVIDTDNANGYSIKFDAKTYGALAKLAPWSGSFTTQGHDHFSPTQHQSISTWRGETETKTYSYNKDGTFGGLKIKDHDKPLREDDASDELTQGTTDVLSAALTTMQNVAEGKACQGKSDIFDGKRRFSLIFRPVSEEMLAYTKYNAYAGPAARCTAEVTPIAGAWREKPRGWLSIQEQGRDKGTMPTVWMASLQDDAPAVPVKVMVKTDYGAFVMHLVEYKSGDVALASKKHK